MRRSGLTMPLLKEEFITEAKRRVSELLRSPPPFERIVRPTPVGELVARFVFPLELLRSQNWSRGRTKGTLARAKAALAFEMKRQVAPRLSPLPGRPFVRCIRWASVEADAFADTFKMAVDILGPPTRRNSHRGMNFIVDDKPKFATIVQHSEPAARGDGVGVIEVYTGDPTADVRAEVWRPKKTQRDSMPRKRTQARASGVASSLLFPPNGDPAKNRKRGTK